MIKEKEEYVKTSLHNHFGSVGTEADYTLNKKSDARFDIVIAKKLIDDAAYHGYQMLGMTNSNCFWYDNYVEIVSYISEKKYNIKLIPGAELNLVYDNSLPESERKYLHVIILIDPDCGKEKNNLKNFEVTLEDMRKKNNENAVTFEDITELAMTYKCILIPHGKKQDSKRQRRGTISNLSSFNELIDIKDFIPIMIENNSKSQKNILLSKLKSDISEEKYKWLVNAGDISSLDRGKSFNDINEPTYIWGENNFSSLFYSSIIGEDRIYREADIIEKSKYIKRIEITNEGGSIESCVINLSHGMNSIIGNSGSGKTALLNLIKLKISGSSLKNAVSSIESNYENLYKGCDVKIYDNNNELMDGTTINFFEGENLYREIIASLNNDKDMLLKNLNSEPSYHDINVRIKLFNSEFEKYVNDRIKVKKNNQSINENLITIKGSIDYIKANSNVPNFISYIEDTSYNDKKEKLENSINELLEDIDSLKNAYETSIVLFKKYDINIDIDSFKLFYFSGFKELIKRYLKSKREVVKISTKMSYQNKLTEIVKIYNEGVGVRAKMYFDSQVSIKKNSDEILKKLRNNYNINNNLSVPSLDENIKNCISVNSDYIKLENVVVNNKVDYENILEYFSSGIGPGINKLNKSLFKDIDIDLYDKSSISILANIFVENEHSVTEILNPNITKFIKFDIMIKDLNEEYKRITSLSAGQLSKIYINYLIDKKLEPIKNSAIVLYDQPDNNLEKDFVLNTLGRKLIELKQKYQVIITTHEPLLVINTDSNAIISAKNEPVSGKSNIKYENLFLYDVGSVSSAVERVSKIIDGSRYAIKVRNQIYGGINL